MTHDRKIIFPHWKKNSLFLSIPFINFTSNLSIPPPPYFYQFLLLLIFINFSSSTNLSIPLLPQIYQFVFLHKFIDTTSFYQFLLFLIFINSSSSLFLWIPLPLQIYRFLLFLIFINMFRRENRSIVQMLSSIQFFDLKSKNYVLKQDIYLNINIILYIL